MPSRKLPTTTKKGSSLAKRSVVVATAGVTTALAGMYLLTRVLGWIEIAPSAARITPPGKSEASSAAVQADHRLRLVEVLGEADARYTQAATARGAALCRAAMLCGARELYLKARFVLNAYETCGAGCAEQTARIERRKSELDRRISELADESAALRHAARIEAIAACAVDPESCNCIDALEEFYCR